MRMEQVNLLSMKKFLGLLVVLAVATGASAQMTDQANLETLSQINSLGARPAESPFSLLDWSRMHWQHSYSVSFVSGGNFSSSVGLWNSRMVYDFSSRLSMGLNLAVAHDISGVSQLGNRTSSVFPGFWLDYHPSQKFRLNLSVQRVPGGYAYNPYSRYSWPRYWSPY